MEFKQLIHKELARFEKRLWTQIMAHKDKDESEDQSEDQSNNVPRSGVSRLAGQKVGEVLVLKGLPQMFVINKVAYKITGPQTLEIVDRLLSAYEVSDAYIRMPRGWQNLFRHHSAAAFLVHVEYEKINNRYTGRARFRPK